jgi:hypothetical protein
VSGASSTLVLLEYLHILLTSSQESGEVHHTDWHTIDIVGGRIAEMSPKESHDLDKKLEGVLEAFRLYIVTSSGY